MARGGGSRRFGPAAQLVAQRTLTPPWRERTIGFQRTIGATVDEPSRAEEEQDEVKLPEERVEDLEPGDEDCR